MTERAQALEAALRELRDELAVALDHDTPAGTDATWWVSDIIHKLDAALSTPVAPAGASESPCLWREDGPTMVTGCGVRNSMLPRNPIKQGWKACPYCKAPLNE